MASSVATNLPLDANSNQPSTTPQHQYGTRIRSNSILKPSARLRQSPDPPPQPRRIRPAPSVATAKQKSMPHDASQTTLPEFPPPHVILHPDDAKSPIFLAIGRSFVSVENRAMTIKDLAEMVLQYGFVCSNVSAAGQAITTYLRNHMQRCDDQQDHPLLLRHVLSGTPSDDDLVPALHSRTGGAHCTLGPSDTRVTNFRKGTMVWYLSRAAGAPCPFARVGIRLCDYGENGKSGHQAKDAKERKRERDRMRRAAQCGQKRKRLLRSCAVPKDSDSESASDEEEKRPPKVKLTLRLRPCLPSTPSSSASTPSAPSAAAASPDVIDLSKESDSDDDSMSATSETEDLPAQEEEKPWSLPPYPVRSISIPPYTPSVEDYHPPFPIASSSVGTDSLGSGHGYRRSPSVPYSVASPPPDSEDEDEDFHISMTGVRRPSADIPRTPLREDDEDDMDWDWDLDGEDGDTETRWGESPGPRSPSAPLVGVDHTGVIVKQEQTITDMRGIMDSWDDLDNNPFTSATAKVLEVVAQAASAGNDGDHIVGLGDELAKVKLEELDSWDWETYGSPLTVPEWCPPAPDEEEPVHVKQEDDDEDVTTTFSNHRSGVVAPTNDIFCSSPLTPLSAFLPSSSSPSCLPCNEASAEMVMHGSSDHSWKDAELLGPDSVHPQEFEDGDWLKGGAFRKTENLTVRGRPETLTRPSLPSRQSPSPSPSPSPHRTTVDVFGSPLSPSVRSPSLSSSVRTMSSPELLLSPVVAFASIPAPPSPAAALEQAEHPEEVVVVQTCQRSQPAVSATQVEGISVYQMTLGSALLFRRIDTDFVNLSPIITYLAIPSHTLTNILNATVVTSGSPTICGTWVPLATAQTFVRDHPLPDGLLDVFLSDVLHERFPLALQDFHQTAAKGRSLNHFGPHFRSTLELKRQSSSSQATEVPSKETWETGASHWDVEDHFLSTHPHFVLDPSMIPRPPMHDEVPVETPLSPTEQEMFQALCCMPDESPRKERSKKSERVEEPEVEVTEDGQSTIDDAAISSKPSLRRSKRVADAVAARTRTRSSKRGSRSSLS
ncbi:hypothetical protein JAAARDRAFT_32991 [Jaapia argillacea MUCL 33604]|uniref:GDS1 winged helix domain-containing protein n=1 Tax=Jaapia argillacea MUCL 33604 TaxID=933084 RepID=A0A067QA47_9AGAM|nr:hypothetical protein JAAARDRAFT_32991 [Jaapia argillacea MUCL 33604]